MYQSEVTSVGGDFLIKTNRYSGESLAAGAYQDYDVMTSQADEEF